MTACLTFIPVEAEVSMEMGDNFFQLDGQHSPLVLQVAVGQKMTVNLCEVRPVQMTGALVVGYVRLTST